MVDDRLGGALLHDHAAVHEDHLIGYVPGEGHLVGDDDHGGVLVGKVADDPQHLTGQFGVQRAGGLVEAQDVRLHSQCPCDGYPLLLTTGQLVGVVVHPLPQPDILQQPPSLGDDALVALAGFLRLGHQLPGQRHILQRRVLREQIEALEHQPEVQPFFADIAFGTGGVLRRVKQLFASDGDDALVRRLQEIQAPQQRGLAAAGGADDAQRLSLLQREADVLQHRGVAKVLFDVLYVQNCHVRHLLLSGNS